MPNEKKAFESDTMGLPLNYQTELGVLDLKSRADCYISKLKVKVDLYYLVLRTAYWGCRIF